jgi:hypothetical protein
MSTQSANSYRVELSKIIGRRGNNMNILYRFNWDCGRCGEIEGLFVADSEDIKKAMGREIYFGEILGKHSEIEGTLTEDDLAIVTDDQAFIARFSELKCESGRNPLRNFKEYFCQDCGEQMESATDDDICATCREKEHSK